MKLKRLLNLVPLALMVVSCGKEDAPKPPTDTNTAPTIEGKTFMVDEDIDDAVVIGTVSAQDDDNDPLEFSIATNSDGLFEIGKTDGKLSLAANKSLDFATKAQHTITVSVNDGTDSAQADMIINVTDVNQLPQMEDQSFEVAENIGDIDVIGTVVAMDDDDLTFEIKQNDGYSINEPLFAISADGQLTLIEGVSLDYETAHEFGIIVTASDGENIVEAWMYITVTDVPEAHSDDKNAFVTTWKTTTDNEEIAIGLFFELSYDYQINWGDGNIETSTNENLDKTITHTYETAGTYTVSIVGTFPYIHMIEQAATPLSLQSIDQWGTIEWETMAGAFKGCTNMVYKATDSPNLENVIIMSEMFAYCSSFNGDLSTWDVSGVLNMSGMFRGTTSFVDGNIGGWITNEVLYMSVMFTNSAFNGDISNWNVSNVIQMSEMFTNAINFNQDLGGWNIKSVNTMYNMLSSSGLDQANYSNTLIGWSAQQNVPADITLGSHELVFCGQEAIDARNELINTYGWQISGDSQCQ
ncbi:BspA family leucine-rich repeat surface protein [Flagellimonas olearia]|uniref:BspA family leucine-rich repeat surface protein n=1 Tax=Flagellimonas olearia TaxID=552546 RepID=A0A6I1DZV9_9FLAO|nr:BspA family leucine-rich repeat surface protein [Allomuricauda olearia]KAB7531063.1 BspA family leucine-rich repeat surface protein [Allomuricauda olearia]